MPRSPVEGSRLKQTPVPQSSPLLPKTICITFTAVPRSSGISYVCRYTHARGEFHDSNTARTARISCSCASVGNGVPGGLLVDPLVALDHELQVRRGQIDVVLDAALVAQLGEGVLEPVRVDALDDLAVHLDQPPVGVVGEPRVAGGGSQPQDRLVVQAEIEDRVHHPRHRDRGARPDRDEQRVRRIAERGARDALEPLDVLRDLVLEPGGQLAAVRHVRAARVGRDREPCGHGHTEVRHLRQPEALAAEQFPATGSRLVEGVHEGRSRPGARGHGRHGALLSK